ncbi:probable tRNA (uracil-O(2)-)-methyltransferase isoform X1 [Sphaerodactylus townsendi]|uniref:probable tRNA (uracil-O(2)-)-methyltransferase isoform X1 n=1 Tax=Sphaerodactylus townsendi TaxID=933632 RepID=UPI002026087D|nr:probable tRNA (uracil-O(2)-)-methyltransferase isoform X1 [Sphaerodactylus townsendi]XP_048365677.1 probable tRNA (uracil-O(2)-)-methyltransferase isoform X1 [Sphaerodactylus townsendi]XP_048365678.1 probable tRNA (uracil-O(2)-)-methyltransferase isoform X1 [Sphaerodactylus townsendi]
MECVGSAAVLDLAEGAARLPGGFWAAVGVWLEKPQVANKRLSGAHLEESRAMPRPRSSPAGAGPGGGGPRAASSELDVAWQALRCSSLGPLLLGPGPAHVDALLRTLLPKGRPAPARELVVRDVFNGTVTFLPLEQNHEGKFKIKECNIYQIKLLHRKVNEWSLSVLSPSPENYVSDGIVYPKTTWLGNELLAKLAKWSLETKKCEFKNTLSLISLARYNNSYQNLKEKYKEIVKVWPEVTDPQKFVYEDVAIAAYLLILWEDERAAKGMSSKQSFVDLGCGNGLLVHILSSEGHPGKGVDVRRRKIWDMYGPQTHLEECAISPNSLFREADWLIGNHSDELTPWIPVMAARSSYSCRYFVLPCCFFDFHGKYNRRQSKKTQYREYLDFVTEVGLVCGFHVEEDCLRIPSTKRVCLIGKSRTYPIIQSAALDEQRARYISRCQCCSMTMPGKVGGFRQRERRPSASRAGGLVADKEVLGNTDMERAFRFQPRGKEPVRNCTALPQDFVDRVVLEVANLLLNGIQRDLSGTSGAWSRGESLTLSEIAARLNEETLKHLRNEYGGLQTLLRNNHQVFEVLSGRVHIRDWREGKLSSGEKPGGTQAEQGAPSKARKTRLCWFAIHHPQGCPMTSGSCSYAHSVEELRPPQRVPKNNPARVPPVDFGSHKEPLPQIMR